MDRFADLPGGRYLEPDVETMPRERLRTLQEERLIRLVPVVYERSPFHRRLWDAAGVHPRDIRSIDDFTARAPTFDKQALRDFTRATGDRFSGLLTKRLDDPAVEGIRPTSGTTGEPTVGVTGYPPTRLAFCRDWWEMGIRPGDYFAYFLFTFRGDGMIDNLRRLGATIVPFDHHPSELVRLATLSRALRPRGLYVMSDPILNLLDQMAPRLGIDPREMFASYRALAFAGEVVTPRIRELAASWGVELFEHGPLGDVGATFECRAHDGLHYWEDGTLVEALDPQSNEPRPDGVRAELVVTSLDDDVVPRLRFRTDDLIEITRTTCACGRTHGRFRIMGRKGDEVVIRGRSVLPRDLKDLVATHPETGGGLFQIVRRSREADTLTLRIGLVAAALDDPRVRDRIRDALVAALDPPLALEFVAAEDLLRLGPPHKIPRVTAR